MMPWKGVDMVVVGVVVGMVVAVVSIGEHANVDG